MSLDTDLAADSLDLASFDRAQTREASGNVWQQIVNLVGLGAKNQDCDCPPDKTSFVREAFVDRQENFKTAIFRDRKEFAILLASEAGLRDSLAVVIDAAVLEFSRNTFVDENFHPSWRTSED